MTQIHLVRAPIPWLSLVSVAALATLGCGHAIDGGQDYDMTFPAASELGAGCEAGPPEPAGTKVGVVSGQIYRSNYSNGRPSWTLGQLPVINDIRARLGASWIRIEIRPTCAGANNDGCEPAGTYEALIPALRSCGLHVLGLLDQPMDPRRTDVPAHPPLGASDATVDAWIGGAYIPRVTEVVNSYGVDALEVINEPNVKPDNVNYKFTPSAFALIVKRTFEHVRNTMGRSSPAIISGGILNLYTSENYYGPVAHSQAFSDYKAVFGRWPLDGFAVHPYQTANWGFNAQHLDSFLLSGISDVRRAISNLGNVPLWVTEFGWQDTCSCSDPTTQTNGFCGCVQDTRACDGQITNYAAAAFRAFRDASANVAAAFWYDYRDDESNPTAAACHATSSNPADHLGARFGLRKNQVDANYRVKPEWYALQAVTGSTASPVNPPVTGCNPNLLPGQSLTRGQTLSSCDGRFLLAMQTDGNLVLYQNGVGALWSTRTAGTTGSTAVMQNDGNFVLYNTAGAPLWSSGTWGRPAAFLAVQNDGNLVVYASDGVPLWSSGTCCH